MRKNTVAGGSGPQYEVVEVTPALADEWLGRNTHNRNLRENAVLAYARDMESGNWAENGESIKFAQDGTLLDGQHRLQAISRAGVTVRMLVVTHLPHSTQETMDDGRKRTLADALALRGETHAVALAAVLRRALLWERGVFRNHGSFVPTNAECLAYLARHSHIRDSAAIGVALRGPTKLPTSVLSLSHWLFSRIDTEDAVWFFDRLGSGAGLPLDHPVLVLRKRALEIWREPTRTPDDALLAFLIKTWNAYRDGEQIKILRFRTGGANPEKFPMPQ